jgi:hypothetical protein
MSTTVTYARMSRTIVRATIPDVCPNPDCRADLTQPGAITEGGFTYYNCEGQLDADGFEGGGGSDFVYDETHAIGYRCTACDATLAGEGADPDLDKFAAPEIEVAATSSAEPSTSSPSVIRVLTPTNHAEFPNTTEGTRDADSLAVREALRYPDDQGIEVVQGQRLADGTFERTQRIVVRAETIDVEG